MSGNFVNKQTVSQLHSEANVCLFHHINGVYEQSLLVKMRVGKHKTGRELLTLPQWCTEQSNFHFTTFGVKTQDVLNYNDIKTKNCSKISSNFKPVFNAYTIQTFYHKTRKLAVTCVSN